ncbi:tannase/feruloyl esterase family alpha/beta hydrolase [Lentzea sp. NEAU-D13]|uniref:Tannase/feruloyl esterase family alpha/beta hydrolase n=1 Tax=Lentzea alba TaxID=2714351 RepID=A0A7C9RR15_9PSEU|nr:tannase/feruloyl esterase family alpha/beta hydrolase [Lentzea alba]NGY60447.1 tannase/feruloyl esterase family alpha/beta hydrolase [Lentzea alba]
MRRLTKLLATTLLLTGLAPLAPASASTPTCAPLTISAPAGAKIESVDAVRRPGGTVEFPQTPLSAPPPIHDVPAYCEITVTLTHADDHVEVVVALPETGWSGRLQGVGGSAYAAGDTGAPLVQAVKDGYTAVTTDAGVLTGLDTSWAVKNGELDQTLLTNFATRSVHEAAVVAKSVVRKHYQRSVNYSYWNGCSTGGRQGYAEAQRFPDDYDGILANAPAVKWTQFAVATLWPQIVQNQDGHIVGNCVLDAFRKAAIEACDKNDGVTNNIVDRPDRCSYDPRQLIGAKILCEGTEIVVTKADADVMRKIWDGPTDERGRTLWPGLPKGADPLWLAGTLPGSPGPGFPVAAQWVQNFLLKQPGFDTSKLTYQQYRDLFRQSVREFDDVIGTSNPDLSAFRRSGGKLITFVGTNDQLIPPGGTLGYRDQVERRMGYVNDFYRLFTAPGVDHCFGGDGPQPTNPLGALVDWVEKGKAPTTLAAATADTQRNLCPYPQFSRYTHGDPKAASSYRCVR